MIELFIFKIIKDMNLPGGLLNASDLWLHTPLP